MNQIIYNEIDEQRKISHVRI